MLSQKYHYFFLILAIQLLIYTVYYFPVCQLLISCEFPAFPWSHMTMGKSSDQFREWPGLQNLHGLQVWVAMCTGVGMDFSTRELQNEPKFIQNGSVLSDL